MREGTRSDIYGRKSMLRIDYVVVGYVLGLGFECWEELRVEFI